MHVSVKEKLAVAKQCSWLFQKRPCLRFISRLRCRIARRHRAAQRQQLGYVESVSSLLPGCLLTSCLFLSVLEVERAPFFRARAELEL